MKLKTKPSLPSSSGKLPHLLVAHACRIPVERGRKIVGQHFVGKLCVDGLGKSFRVFQIGGLGFHPQQVGKWRGCQRLGDCVINSALDLIKAFRRFRRFAIPNHVDAHCPSFLANLVERRTLGKLAPFIHRHVEALTIVFTRLHGIGNRAAKSLELRF